LSQISPQPNSLVITAKALDSDAVDETIQELEPISSENAMRAQISERVRSLYPQAELRSFADGAATYLAPKLLIVAVYRLAGGRGPEEGDEDDGQQQQLFAA